MKKILCVILLAIAAFGAVTKISMPTDYSSVSSGTRANLKANFDETQTRFNASADSIDEVRGRLSGYTGDFTISALDNLRLRLDTDGSQTSRFYISNGYTSDTLFRVTEDSTWRFYAAGTGTKLTLSDSILAATANISGLTASRLMATNSGKTLASVSDLTAWIAGTSNQITSTSDGDGSITLSIPNSFTLPSASPTFTGLTLTGNETIGGTLDIAGNVVIGTTNSTAIALKINTSALAQTSQSGIESTPTFSSAATTQGLAGYYQLRTQAAAFTMLNGYGLRIGGPSIGSGSAVTTLYGLKVDNQTGGGTNYAIHTSTGIVSLGDVLTVAGAATFATNFTQSAGTHTVSVDDNTANAVDIQQGSNNYINVNTTNSSENVSIGNATTNPTVSLLGTGVKTIDGTINTDLTASRTVVTDGSGNLSVNTETGTGSHMKAASPTTTGTLTGAAANFSGAVSTGALTATTVTTGGGEAFTYGDTTFTLTATGMTTSPTGTAYATRVGNSVTLRIPFISGTSNATTFTLTGVPSGWYPATIQVVNLPAYGDNGSPGTGVAYIQIGTSGTLTLATASSGPLGWTSSGTKYIGIASGSYSVTITYNLQ